MRSLVLLFLPSLALAAPKPDSSSSYGAPHAPVYDSYSAPPAPTYAKQQYYPPQQQYVNPPDSHVHHHYYHQAQPVVQVPITPQPYVVQVPQNVPVQFVPINVDVPPPQYQTVPVHLAPQQGYVLPDRSECYDYDLECLGNIGRDFGLPIPHPYQGPVAAPYQYPGPSPYAGSPFGGGGLAAPYQYPGPSPYAGSPFRGGLGSLFGGGLGGFGGGFDDPYIKRKELIKSGLLLGAGVIKGALVTTLINQATQNGK
ncbi:leucine-rich repeat extensin-like protein 1 isoform X2 [Eurytemora carolleeae]|uniref:leucine-rich repeat extensin-like protein 1 isoform X2 n=1 Tax=Eurytemora carolleeae TaxID=1294199 RepID=UPI000C77DF58|nr:leucine-rich repeat extensin-like protein 1 isoform X2 [Eurytemora carolleeae]|eukprot:XP_023320842.1 leucine-rich repeat extensin-like protein 1 isoform X2 [Eurytemora affinis]